MNFEGANFDEIFGENHIFVRFDLKNGTNQSKNI